MGPSKKKKGCASKAKNLNEENCPYCLQWVPSLDTHLKYVNGNCRAQLEYDASPLRMLMYPLTHQFLLPYWKGQYKQRLAT